MSPTIELAGVGKRYVQLEERAMLLKSLLPGYRPKKSELWAVRDLSLKVDEGETLGILGHNGAGKTTLLRMLAGVSRPTTGNITVRGRVAPLIGVGVGFHAEMSGRENVLVNGMLLGLSRQEIEARFDEIVEFAELQKFIDTPVKFYSSGMYMRLGFSVAVHVKPNVLLVDEVLAVGDLGFQRKCFDRMRELQVNGTTVLIVSHSMHAIRLLCPRAILIRQGRLELDGSAENVIARHHELMSRGAADDGTTEAPVDMVSRSLEGAGGPTHHPEPGEMLRYRVTYRFNRSVDSPQFFFRVTSDEGLICYQVETVTRRQWREVKAGEELEVEIAFQARLGGGTFHLGMIVSDCQASRVLNSDLPGLAIYIVPRVGTIGTSDLDASISVSGVSLSDHGSVLITTPPKDSAADS